MCVNDLTVTENFWVNFNTNQPPKDSTFYIFLWWGGVRRWKGGERGGKKGWGGDTSKQAERFPWEFQEALLNNNVIILHKEHCWGQTIWQKVLMNCTEGGNRRRSSSATLHTGQKVNMIRAEGKAEVWWISFQLLLEFIHSHRIRFVVSWAWRGKWVGHCRDQQQKDSEQKRKKHHTFQMKSNWIIEIN